MLARLQQVISSLIMLCALGCVWWAISRSPPWPGLVGASVLLSAHAVFLGAEFLFVKAQSKRSTAQHEPSWPDLARAWWAEVLAAPRVFCWQQPFRSRLYPDYLPEEPSGKTGVLLIHGFFCNRGFWNRWLSKLTSANQPVVAVNLEPILGSIDRYTATIESAITKLERRTGRPPIAVAHSMGGLALRAWLASHPANGRRVQEVITLGSPHRGTALARIAFSANGRQMRRGSAWLSTLEEREAKLPLQPPFTCYYSHCDNIVFPAETATLPRATNRHLPATAHVHMASSPAPWNQLQALLADADREIVGDGNISPRP